MANNAVFYLVDGNSGGVLSSIQANIAPQDTLDPNPTAGDGVPGISGPNGASSVSMWYLGGAPSIDGFSTQAMVTLQVPTPSTPNAQIAWSTDSPARLAITPSPDGTSATLTAVGASAYQAGYDIHVTVSYNGKQSKPFPVFNNVPFTMTTQTSLIIAIHVMAAVARRLTCQVIGLVMPIRCYIQWPTSMV